jgi:hypothetical protein
MAIETLFGPSIADVQELRRLQAEKEIAGAGGQFGVFAPLYQASLRFGNQAVQGMNTLLGAQDPMLKKATDIQGILTQYQGQDLTDAAVLKKISSDLASKGYAKESLMTAQEAARYAKEASIEKRAVASELRAEESAKDTRYKNNPELLLRDALALPEDDPTRTALLTRYSDIVKDKNYSTAKQEADLAKAKADLAKTQAETAKLRAQANKESKLLSLTPAQKAVDSKFAVEYNSFVNAGGASTVNKILEDLDKVETELASGKNITGRLVGVADTTGTLAYVNPAAQRVKDLAGGVIQSNLRSILGGQFAQKEGAELLARAYNPAASQEDNLSRIRELKKQIKASLAAKVEASRFYEENGTLSGYKGTKFVLESPRETPKETATGGQTGDWKILP